MDVMELKEILKTINKQIHFYGSGKPVLVGGSKIQLIDRIALYSEKHLSRLHQKSLSSGLSGPRLSKIIQKDRDSDVESSNANSDRDDNDEDEDATESFMLLSDSDSDLNSVDSMPIDTKNDEPSDDIDIDVEDSDDTGI